MMHRSAESTFSDSELANFGHRRTDSSFRHSWHTGTANMLVPCRVPVVSVQRIKCWLSWLLPICQSQIQRKTNSAFGPLAFSFS